MTRKRSPAIPIPNSFKKMTEELFNHLTKLVNIESLRYLLIQVEHWFAEAGVGQVDLDGAVEHLQRTKFEIKLLARASP